MKRKTIKSGIALLCLLGGIYFYYTQSDKNVLSDLAFENIECHGDKVERKTSGFR